MIDGTEPLPGAAQSGGGVVSGSWLSDLTGAVTSVASAVLPAVGTYFQNQASIKNAMARAAVHAGPPPQLTYPGLGYSAAQLTPSGAMPANYVYAGPQGLQVGPGDMQPSVQLPGGAAMAGGGNFHSAGSTARANAVVMDVNPLNGKVHVGGHPGPPGKRILAGVPPCGAGRRPTRPPRPPRPRRCCRHRP